MRTAEEIMKEVANNHSYEDWAELMYDSHSFYQVDCTKEAMQTYAREALEEAAKNAKVKDRELNEPETVLYITGVQMELWKVEVVKESITGIELL